MSDRPGSDSSAKDTPPLFEDLERPTGSASPPEPRPEAQPEVQPELRPELRPDAEPGGSDVSGLERLVTRVSDHSRSWSMKWRPDADASSEDRHPARATTPPDEGHRPPALTLVADSLGRGPDERASVDADEPLDQAEPDPAPPPFETRPAWRPSRETSPRHPATPAVVGAVGEDTPTTVASAGDQPSFDLGRVAGWVVAVVLLGLWASSGGRVSSTSESGTEAPILARPASDGFEADLARAEIASLREERVRLSQEVQAAEFLVEDHRRLSAALESARATAVERDLALASTSQDAARWQRRHAVAMERLDELAGLLAAADLRASMLEAALAGIDAGVGPLDESPEAE